MFRISFYQLSAYSFIIFLSAACSIAEAQQNQSSNNIFSDALTSKECNSDMRDDLKLFGQFIGSWKFEWTGYNNDGTTQVVKNGEWIFSWILEGRAIQDVWILPGRNERMQLGALKGEYGTTLRCYDPELKKWKIIWIGAIQNRIRTFTAERTAEEIVLTENPPKDILRKWIFSEITANSFRWREEISFDKGNSWKLSQEFRNTRTQ